MGDKYISFGPYFSGLSNVIMSYEIAFAISYITKRKIILPPKTWISHVEQFVNIWEIFDEDIVKSEFDCVEFRDVPEIRDNLDLIKGEKSYTQNIEKYVEDLYSIKFFNSDGKNVSLCSSNLVLTKQKYATEDFKNFLGRVKRRKILCLDLPEKFIHFEDNLFGSFWYHVYPGDSLERDKLKEKINKSFRYKKRYYDISESVTKKLGEYNALHIRRGDFLLARNSDYLSSIDSGEKILEKILPIISNDIPLYIATDESDLSFFDPLRKSYKIYFYQDFGYDFNVLERAILEQVVCSNANDFYGTWFSTYTKRINVMRGCDGKPAPDWRPYNYDPPLSEIPNMYTPFPWNFREDGSWYWYLSWHLQWTFEN